MSAEKGNGCTALPPMTAEDPMPPFLVEKGFRQGSVPRILISGRGGSYDFTFHAPRWPDVLPEQVENLFPRRGATGSPGYVQREARGFLEEILSGSFEQRRRRTA